MHDMKVFIYINYINEQLYLAIKEKKIYFQYFFYTNTETAGQKKNFC